MNLNKIILINKISSNIKYNKTNNKISFTKTKITINKNYSNNNKITNFIPVIT